jgi:hypothetical protein
LTWKPFSFATASVSPTLATCGSVYVQPGIRVLFTGLANFPAIRAATTSQESENEDQAQPKIKHRSELKS